jgi:Helicase HerA, central domain
MVPGFDTESLNMLGKLIGKLERYHLEGAIPAEFDPVDLLDDNGQSFFRIDGLANFWQQRGSIDFGTHMIDLVIGAYNQHRADLTLIMLGTPQRLSCYLSLGTQKNTRTLLEGIFPGIMLTPIATAELSLRLRPHLLTRGILTGIPSGKTFSSLGRESQQGYMSAPGSLSSRLSEQSQLERVIRGMYGATWAYVVQAHPRPRNKVIEERMKTIDLLTQVTSRSNMQWQSTKQDNQQFTAIESSGRTQTYSGNMINYRAQYLIRLLERELERLDQGAAIGQWLARAYFGASDSEDAERLASLLLGTLAGPDSRPEPLRSTLCEQAGKPLDAFQTFLTSSEVALLTQLPREEVSGYAIHDYVHFDIDFQTPDATNLPLGHIQQHGRDTSNTFNISLDALAKHAVVIGVTGSGKTTTVMNLLDRVVDAEKPFLVIEPAKTEYRSLRKVLAARTDLRIYTLGNEMVAPFRLNPFEFETDDEPGNASLLTHIDYLKAVFNAAFVLYAPMPHVLESALHEVYEDKGWDLASGLNRRIPDWSQRHRYPIFPTLTDLYNKVSGVTEQLGYDPEVESNVKAGLKSRIGSLRIGSKGLMLDTARGISMQNLLSTPTILEMESIGSDDEKTFLMGLFLARLYEYRRLQAATGILSQNQGLQHLIVFEEAHRLLQNTAMQVDSEVANPRAQAIEVFTNMLSEMRAYGQGVLVAEQIPSKLAPDVLKNTNLKIVHRLIAQDDRVSIGQTMNLNEEQQVYLGTLTPGMAAVYAEGADHAYLVRLDNYKRHITPLVDAELRRISHDYALVRPFMAITELDIYDPPLTPTGELDLAAYQAAGRILITEKSKRLWAHILLGLVANPVSVFETLRYFSEIIEAELPRLSPEQHDAVMRMIIIRGSAEELHERGSVFGWNYAYVEDLHRLLARGLQGFTSVDNLSYEEDEVDMEALMETMRNTAEQAGEHLEQFVISYTSLLQRKQGPFVGCVHCQAKCLYRAEVSALLSETDQKWIDNELIVQTYSTDAEHYNAVIQAAGHTAQKWLGQPLSSELSDSVPDIAYCATLHTMSWAELNEYEQIVLSSGLKRYLLDGYEDGESDVADGDSSEDGDRTEL